MCVFCRRFAVSFVATPPLLRDICVTFAVLPCASAVLLHLCVTLCHVLFLPTVVPGVSRRLCFAFLCFWGRASVVSALFLLFFSVCCLCGVGFSGFCCAVVWCVWFRCVVGGLLGVVCGWLLRVGVGCCSWCVLYFYSVWCLVVWLCGCVRDFVVWLLRVCGVCLVVLLFLSVLILVCFGLVRCFGGCCSCSAVLWSSWLSSGWLSWLCCSVRFFAPGGPAPLFWFLVRFPSWLFLLCVAPSWCWLLLVRVAPVLFMLLLVRVLLFWWFLVVVGPPPLFLLLLVLSSWWWLVDLGCFSSSWFFFLTFFATPGWGGLCVVLPVLV